MRTRPAKQACVACIQTLHNPSFDRREKEVHLNRLTYFDHIIRVAAATRFKICLFQLYPAARIATPAVFLGFSLLLVSKSEKYGGCCKTRTKLNVSPGR
ncbi:hypothetical protein BJX62DRAFT_28575 [Aspergillus germanicus]